MLYRKLFEQCRFVDLLIAIFKFCHWYDNAITWTLKNILFKDTKNYHGHFIISPFPRQTFIKKRIIMCSNKKGLPFFIWRMPFSNMKYLKLIWKIKTCLRAQHFVAKIQNCIPTSPGTIQFLFKEKVMSVDSFWTGF